MAEQDGLDETELVNRLQAIEAEPLEDRAAAFTKVHDELQQRLESGDAPRPDA